jgi:ubiquinone/menaquinone biosynthesis C-methylase UbiE
MHQEEVQLIRERYARRSTRYDPWEPWIYESRQRLERGIITALSRAGMFPPGGRTVLDLGCGSGNTLLFFLQLGFPAESLHGIDLIEQRVEAARTRLPSGLKVEVAEASRFPGADAAFDIVFQSMLFSSVLDSDMRRKIAANMWRMVRRGGGVLWYDFTWDNPRNPDVRGIRVDEVRRLFPHGKLHVQRVTLAPPLARAVGRFAPFLYGFLDAFPFLRTHVVAWIAKN